MTPSSSLSVLIYILSAIGLGITSYIIYDPPVHLDRRNNNKPLEAPSPYINLIAIIYYIICILYPIILQNIFGRYHKYIFLIGTTIALSSSIYLAYILYMIGDVCPICLAAYTVNFSLAMLAFISLLDGDDEDAYEDHFNDTEEEDIPLMKKDK